MIFLVLCCIGWALYALDNDCKQSNVEKRPEQPTNYYVMVMPSQSHHHKHFG